MTFATMLLFALVFNLVLRYALEFIPTSSLKRKDVRNKFLLAHWQLILSLNFASENNAIYIHAVL